MSTTMIGAIGARPISLIDKIAQSQAQTLTVRPGLLESFDTERNLLDPECVAIWSNKDAWWTCNAGCRHEGLPYIQRIDSRASKADNYCIFCAHGSVSRIELEVFDFIRGVLSDDIDVFINLRVLPESPTFPGANEVDILVPALNLGWEVSSPYHRFPSHYPAGYDQDKIDRAESIGITLHTVWHQDWVKDPEGSREQIVEHIYFALKEEF